MENRVNYILVGIFTIGIFLAGLFTIFWLGKYSEDQVFKYYKVNTKDSVSGLSEKAPVKLRGVSVGEVSKIEINAQNSEEVSIIIKVKVDTPIKEDTYAKIEPQGITGLSYLGLDGGSNTSPALKTSSHEERMGVIFTHPSIFSRVDKTLESVSEKTQEALIQTNEAMERVNRILSEKNIKNFEITLENSAKLSASLASLITSMESQKKNLDIFMKKALELETSSIKMTEEITNSVKYSGISMMQKMSSAADAVKKMSKDMEQKLNSGMFDMQGVARDIVEPATQAVSEFNSLLIGAQKLMQQLQDSPSDILYKNSKPKLGPGEE